MAKRKFNKSAAMREALTTLGMDAHNDNLKAYLKDKYKFEPTNFSVLKSAAVRVLNGETGSSGKSGSGDTLGLLQQLAKRVGGMRELANIVGKLQ